MLAGVSVKTVSNVVNDYPFVRPTTRAKVQEAIDALGYRPNIVRPEPAQRTLRRDRPRRPRGQRALLRRAGAPVVRAAIERGWTVLVDETGQTNDQALRDRERSAASGIRGQLIDGVILSPLALDEADLARYGSVPLVLLGERLGSHLADHVAIDNRAAAKAATRHLLDIGRRRIAVIGTQPPPFGTAPGSACRATGPPSAPRRSPTTATWPSRPSTGAGGGAGGGPPPAGPPAAAGRGVLPERPAGARRHPGAERGRRPGARGRRGGRLRRHRGEPVQRAHADHRGPGQGRHRRRGRRLPGSPARARADGRARGGPGGLHPRGTRSPPRG